MKFKDLVKKNYGVVLTCLVLGLWALPKAYPAIDRTYEQLKILVDVLDYIKENYVEEMDTQKLVYGAANGMVRTLDPFSQFMEPDVHKDIKTETEGQFGGLGIRLGTRENWLTVITPLPGTPAFRMGILPGDRIIKIEGESTKDLTIFDAVKKLRGAPGTKVAITVAREPAANQANASWSTHDFTLTREIIKIESVQGWMLKDKVAYLRIIEFTALTAQDVAGTMVKLRKQGAEALVMDLRNNPGGLLSAAVEVANSYMGGSRMIVYTKGRRPENYQEFRSNARSPYEGVPMVVLVNGGSASGSEIVAGAFQDNKRAVVIGSRTYGKASVQSVIPLSDGSGLRLTVAKYYTPSGKSIQRNEKDNTGGISPDIEINVSREVEAKLQSQAEQIFKPGENPKSMVKEEERVKDEVLDRAMEIIKARDVLTNLRAKDG
ncbi:MAG: S41 family peptidase [Elusimicrobia bacterium]|nr:S41 family peptidase [Elusimicrobiota bacterium]